MPYFSIWMIWNVLSFIKRNELRKKKNVMKYTDPYGHQQRDIKGKYTIIDYPAIESYFTILH